MSFQRLALCGISMVLAINVGITARTVSASQDDASQMAVLRGKIKFSGQTPPPTQINTAPEPACRGQVLFSESVQLSNQGLENVMVYVSSPMGTSAPSQIAAVLEQKNCRFEPHVLTVQAGQPVIFKNSDPTLQNVHAFTEINTPFNIGMPMPSQSVHVFDKPEQFPIHCDVHRWETAFIGVFAHPYHTVSRSGGLYELRLPAGTYEISAWHEKLGVSKQSISVTSGQNYSVDFDFR